MCIFQPPQIAGYSLKESKLSQPWCPKWGLCSTPQQWGRGPVGWSHWGKKQWSSIKLFWALLKILSLSKCEQIKEPNNGCLVRGFVFKYFKKLQKISLSFNEPKFLHNYCQAPPMAEKANYNFFCGLAVIIHSSPFCHAACYSKGWKQLDDGRKWHIQFERGRCDDSICIFSSVAVYYYQQTEQKEDERKDNQREHLIKRSAG